MTKHRSGLVVVGDDRDGSDLGGVIYGYNTPRIHSPLNDLPSKGSELIEFAKEISLPLLPWQEWIAEHAHKVKPDGRWKHSNVCVVVARQNGKSTLMMVRIMAGLFLWNDGLQIGSAHRLTTSLETFRHIVNLIESNDRLASEVKKIRWAHGAEEIELKSGNRYIVKAANAAARGISKPETVFMDELRDHKDEDAWASMRYTMMAAKNPQVWTLSNAGDNHSIILNQLRERGLAAAAGGDDEIGYFEYSAISGCRIDDVEGWRHSNPALGRTIHIDNLKAVLNDPIDVVRTEVLCQWIETINPCIPPVEWANAGNPDVALDPGKTTWFGLDLSPDRRNGALVAAQRLDDEKFQIQLLHTWHNPISLDDKQIANDIAPYVRKYSVDQIVFSKRTASAVAARLIPAGFPVIDCDGAEYAQSCDEFLGSITSGRLVHSNQAELTKQVLSAVRLPYGDGAWVIGRRASKTAVCATVASALATHYATRPETEIDILVG